MSFVYLLKSKMDNKQYIGSTTDLKRRLADHNSGKVRSTKNRRPFILLGYQACDNIQEAASLERKYKKSHDSLNRAIAVGRFKLVDGE